MKAVLLLVLFIGLYETRHYLVETKDNNEGGTDYKGMKTDQLCKTFSFSMF